MKTWKIDEAQSHFREILHFCHQEPQLVADQDELLAVVADIKFPQDLTETQISEERPTISQLFDELEAIKMIEPVDIEIPKRHDRHIMIAEG